MNLSDPEAFAFLESLFPGGLKDPALIADLCPEGWEKSSLFACYHPSPRVQYEESLERSQNLKRLGLSRRMAGSSILARSVAVRKANRFPPTAGPNAIGLLTPHDGTVTVQHSHEKYHFKNR